VVKGFKVYPAFMLDLPGNLPGGSFGITGAAGGLGPVVAFKKGPAKSDLFSGHNFTPGMGGSPEVGKSRQK
jgi:hypothetical protein